MDLKKVIGTFDTLVACRDYANAIYNMLTTMDQLLHQLFQMCVADRRIDLNYACDVATFDSGLGVIVESIPLKNKGGADDITIWICC